MCLRSKVSDCIKRIEGSFNIIGFSIKTAFSCAAIMSAAGTLLTMGLWKPLLSTILRINPVSEAFQIKLTSMVQNTGLILVLVGIAVFLITLVLKGNSDRRKNDYVFVGLLVLSSVVFFGQTQPLIELNSHMAWDGSQYYSMFHWFRNGVFPIVAPFGEITPVYPYSQRLLVPWLAGLIPYKDSLLCFRTINTLFLTGAGIMMYYLWSNVCRLPKWLSLVGILFFIFHWVSPIRGLSNCVYSVDAPVYFFEALMLCLVFTKRFRWLVLLAPLATLCKEQFVYIFLLFWIYSFIYNWIRQKKTYPVKLLGFTFILSVLTSVSATNFPFHGHGFGGFTVAFFVWNRFCEPLGYVRWAVALMTAYGAIGILAAFSKNCFSERQILLSVLSGLFLVFSLFGATDMTRTAFLGFPFVMSWILLKMESQVWYQNCLAVILTIPVMRLLTSIPEPANPLPGNDISGAYSWVPEYADLSIVAAWGLYFVFCFIFLKTQRNRYESNNIQV